MLFNQIRAPLLLAGLLLVAGGPGSSRPAHAAELSASVARPLQAARSALAAGHYASAMKSVQQADAAASKTAHDRYVIDQMRAAVAARAGQKDVALAAYDRLIAAPQTSAAMRLKMLGAEVALSYKARDYARLLQDVARYRKAGGQDVGVLALEGVARYERREYGPARDVLSALVKDSLLNGRPPAENVLLLLLASQHALKDEGGEVGTYITLLQHYPKPQYWDQIMYRLMRRADLSAPIRLQAYQLQMRAGSVKSASQFMDMAELAVQSGYPGLGRSILEQGYKSGVLGRGAEAARARKLQAFVAQAADKAAASLPAQEQAARKAPKGDALVRVGYNYLTFGQKEKGLSLMHEGVARGCEAPATAQLYLGLALVEAGHQPEGQKVLQDIKTVGPALDVASLWLLKFAK